MAENLTVKQLCQAETVYLANLDDSLFDGIRKECPKLLVPPEDKEYLNKLKSVIILLGLDALQILKMD